MNNYLVNPFGLPGHWHEPDLVQEHFNGRLKGFIGSKTLEFSSNFLRYTIALNLSGFSSLYNMFPSVFRLQHASGHHPDADRTGDINHLGDHYRDNDILRFRPGRQQQHCVANEFADGFEKLMNGQLASFLQRTSDTTDMPDIVDSEHSTEDQDDVMPTAPIVIENGNVVLHEFVEPMR